MTECRLDCMNKRVDKVIKRIIDIVLSFMGLVILSPIF